MAPVPQSRQSNGEAAQTVKICSSCPSVSADFDQMEDSTEAGMYIWGWTESGDTVMM